MDITKLGLTLLNGSSEPVVGITQMAPPELMKVVACGCIADKTCSQNTCRVLCKAAGLSCMSYFKYLDQGKFYNPYEKQEVNEDSNRSDAEEVEME